MAFVHNPYVGSRHGSGKVSVFDIETATERLRFDTGSYMDERDLQFATGGRRLAYRMRDVLRVHDADTGLLVVDTSMHADIACLAAHPYRTLYAIAHDNTVTVLREDLDLVFPSLAAFDTARQVADRFTEQYAMHLFPVRQLFEDEL